MGVIFLDILQVGGSSGFIFFYEEDKKFSVGLFNLLNNPYRKIELPSAWRTEKTSPKSSLGCWGG
jgi:hypothetical protein